MSQLRTHYQEHILDNVLSNSLRDTYHINRYGDLEINYTNLEDAFVDAYGKEVGYLLFTDICDEVDIEQLAVDHEHVVAESRLENFAGIDFNLGDLGSTLSIMNEKLYAKTA